MVNMSDSFLDRHKDYYQTERPRQNEGRVVTPGSQYLVHLLRGGYLGAEWREGRGRAALDVGCGSGFNLVTLERLGWRIHGTEISEDIARHARDIAASYGCQAEVRVGENESLPFEDASFDLLVSMNVIHYVQSEEAVHRSFAEYARVLRPGGRLFLSTNHPDNWLVADAEPLAGSMVRVRLPGDYRDGQTLFMFPDEARLRAMLEPWFDGLLLGENRFDFFTRVLRHRIATGTRK